MRPSNSSADDGRTRGFGPADRTLEVLASLRVRTPLWQALVLAAVVALSLGSSWHPGTYSSGALLGVLTAAVLLGAAILALRFRAATSIATVVWPLGVVGSALMNVAPGLNPDSSAAIDGLGAVLAAACLLLTIVPLRGRAWLIAGVAAAANLALVRIDWGYVHIDVFWFIQGATQALLEGHNPYGAWYPTTTPQLAAAHFPYGPGLLLLAAPFRLAGDVRAASAAAMVLLFLCVALLARRHLGELESARCLALALALPFAPFMIFQAWPEVYPVAGIAMWLVLRDQHRWWGALALGVALCTVPTPAVLLVLPWLWWRSARLEIVVAAGVAVAVAAPFAVWAGVGNFVSDTAGLQLSLATRVDAISVNAMLWHLGRAFLPWWAGVGVTAGGLVVFAISGKRDWSSALLLGATVTLVAFLTAKWAFFDYYFIVAYGLVLSLSLARPVGWRDPGPGAPSVPVPTRESTPMGLN